MVFTKGNQYTFKPGNSGNPSGANRPAAAKEWAENCRVFMSEKGGFDLLIAIAQGKGDPKDQLKAIQFIAEHGYGKAVTQIAGADESDFNKLEINIGPRPPEVDATLPLKVSTAVATAVNEDADE